MDWMQGLTRLQEIRHAAYKSTWNKYDELMDPYVSSIKYKIVAILLPFFFLSIAGVELFIFQKQSGISTDFSMLWISILVALFIMLLTIILKLKWSISFSLILILYFLLSIMFVPKTGLYGTDANHDYYLIKLIDKFGWNIHSDDLAPWPMIHLFIDISSKVINISLLDSSRYLPSITSAIVLFFLFCLSKRMHKNYLSPLIYMFLFSTIFSAIFFHSVPIRENFGFLFLFAGSYCQLASLEVKDTRFKFLSIFFGLSLIISHHFSTFLFLVFLISLTTAQNLFYIIKRKNNFLEWYSRNIGYFLLILTSTLFYWIFVNRYIFNEMISSLNSFISFGEASERSYFHSIYPPLLDRPQLLQYSPRATFILAILLIIIYTYQNYNRLTQYDYTIFIFVLITGIVFFISNYVLINISIYPERIQTFTWAFLLIFLSKILGEYIFLPGIVNIKKLMAFSFIISLVAMNFAQVEESQYDPNIPPRYDYGRIRGDHLETEYLSTDWFKAYTNQSINGGLIQTDRPTEDLLLNINSSKLATSEEFFRQNSFSKLYNTGWAIIRMEMFNRIIGTTKDNPKIKKPLNLSKNTYNFINQEMIKVYTNRDVDIYSRPFMNDMIAAPS